MNEINYSIKSNLLGMDVLRYRINLKTQHTCGDGRTPEPSLWNFGKVPYSPVKIDIKVVIKEQKFQQS